MQRNKTKSNIETFRPILNKGVIQFTNNMLRNKPTVNSLSPKPSISIKQTTKCGQCSTEEAKMKCVECMENYCLVCFNHFHLRGALQRHHRIFLSESQLSTSPRKLRSFNSEINIQDAYSRQLHEDLPRTSTITSNIRAYNELRNLKTNYTSLQSSFFKWRTNYLNTSKSIRPINGLITPISETTTDRIDYFNRLPNVESNSSRLPTNEKILSKRYRSIDKNNQKKSTQQSKKPKKKDEPKIGVMINIYYTLTENLHLNDPSIDIEPLDENISEVHTENSEQTTIETEEQEYIETNVEHVEESERPVTHISSKSDTDFTSASPKKSSETIVEESLRSILATKSNEELEAIVYSELILSQSILSSIDDYEPPSNLSSQNQIVEHRISDDQSIQSTVIDHCPVAHFDSSLNDLSYESKIISSNQLSKNNSTVKIEENPPASIHNFSLNSPKPTQHQYPPLSFIRPTFELHRTNSFSSIEASDDCFFTDVLLQEKIPPARIFSSKKPKEKGNVSENQLAEQNTTRLNSSSIPKACIESSGSKDEKHSPKLEKTPLESSQLTSSISLPVSIQSSRMEFDYSKHDSSAASSRKSSLSSTSTNSSTSIRTTTKSLSLTISKKPSSAASKTSSSSTAMPTSTKLSQLTSTSNNSSLELETAPLVIEENTTMPLSFTNEKSIQQSISSSSEHSQQNLRELSRSNSSIKQTENENHSTMKDKPQNHRQITNSEELLKLRKLEFSMEDGLKWQAASAESLSSTQTISSLQSLPTTNFRSITSPHNNRNHQSTLMYEKVNNNEKCLNYIHQENGSTHTKNGNDKNGINEHLLQILRNVELALDEKISTMN